MKAREKGDLGVYVTIHKTGIDYKITEGFKFLRYN